MTTNRTNQLGPIVKYSEDMNDSHREMKEFEFSVTETQKPATMIVLQRRFKDKIKRDVQDMADINAGTALHATLQKYFEDDGYICEQELRQVFELSEGEFFVLTGKFDAYSPSLRKLVDIKNTKLATFNKQSSGKDDEWFRQTALYCMLLYSNNPSWFDGVETVTIEARITDLSVVKEAKAGNSTDKWRRIDWNWSDMCKQLLTIQNKMLDNIREVQRLKSVPTEELPICSEEDRWAERTWKIYKRTKDGTGHLAKAEKGHASYESEEEAKEGFGKAGFDPDSYVIDSVGGESIRCKYYCEVAEFCPHYKKMMEAQDEV